MMPLLADEHVSWAWIDGLRARQPDLEVIRVLDVGLGETDDREILAWAAEHGYVIVTKDRDTMPGFAFNRVASGEPMAGVIVYRDDAPLGHVIDDLLVMAVCGNESDFKDQIQYIPLNPPILHPPGDF